MLPSTLQIEFMAAQTEGRIIIWRALTNAGGVGVEMECRELRARKRKRRVQNVMCSYVQPKRVICE